jgi:ELWxxDGT repeat protein
MEKRISTLLLIFWVCFQVSGQEQLTHIKGIYGANSSPRYLGTVHGKTIFVSYTEGAAVWVTDRTEAGTHFVKAIPELIKDVASDTDVAVKDGFIYFLTFGKEYANYPQLWRTDGTVDGTSKVLESVTDMGDESYRPINLIPSDNFFFISLHYTYQIITKKYNYNFELISTEASGLGSADSYASGRFVPTVYKDEIYVKFPFVYVENGAGYSMLNKADFVIDGNLYRTYATNLSGVYSDNDSPVIMGAVKASIQNEVKSYYLRLSRDRKITSFEYKSFGDELYAVIISFDKAGVDTGLIELYQLNKNTGFELKGTYSNQGLNPFEAPIMEQTDTALNIISNYTDFRHIVIDLQTYQQKIIKILKKQERITAVGEGIIEIQIGSAKVIYLVRNGIEVPISESILNQGKIDNDTWFVSTNMGKGFEPYTFDMNTGKLTLIKDINQIGINIFSPVAVNKQAVWYSIEENGINLYKSDGTKEGTRLLSNISTIIPRLPPASFNSWSVSGSDLIYNITANMDNAEMYNNIAPIHFATNGTDKAIKLFESKAFIEGASVQKIGENYYYAYGIRENGVLVVKTVKVSPDGKQELLKTLDLSKTPYPIADVRSVSNIGEAYFSINVSSDYLMSNIINLIIDATTGDLINKNFEKHLTTFKNNLYFVGNDLSTGKKSVLIYENNSLTKLFELTGDKDPVLLTNPLDEVIIWEAGNLWITDGTTGGLKKITGFPLSPNNIAVRKFRDNYLFHSYFDNNSKWIIYSNGAFKEPMIPGPLPAATGLVLVAQKGIAYQGKLYFYATRNIAGNADLTRITVYAFDGNDVTEVFNLADFTKAGTITLEEDYMGGLWFFGKATPNLNELSAIYWKPGMDAVTLARGQAIVRCDTLPGHRIIMKVYSTVSNGDGRSPYKLYISDGTSPAQLVSDIEFRDYGNSIKPFAVVGNKFYFSASTNGVNFEPWVTDGTPQGTRMAADLWEGEKGSKPENFMDVNGIPVCVALTPDNGYQLFSLQVKLTQPLISVPNTEACEGDTILLTAPKDFESYKWIINDNEEVTRTDNKLSVTKSGNYKLIVSKGGNSSVPSNIVSIKFKPLPAKPVITQDNSRLSVSSSGQLQWYFNGSAIAGATTHTLTYTGAGDYSVKVTENGCSVFSDKQLISVTSTEQLFTTLVYPNPVSTTLMVETKDSQPVQLKLMDIRGNVVLQKKLTEPVNKVDLGHFSKGVYILQLNQHSKKIIIE